MSQATNNPIPITTALNISALARDAGVSRKTVKRRLGKGWRPPAPTPPIQAPTPLGPPGRTAPVNGAIASMTSACAPLGLTQLRDEIKEWATLNRKVSKLKARERSGRTGRAVPMVLLVIAVAFYALIAYAAVN
jgi:hypothetical protein